MQSIDEIIARLMEHPDVVGLVRYGSDHGTDAYAFGDCDLFAVLKQKPDVVENLHFYVDAVPVDLNLTSLEGIRHLEADAGFHLSALLNGGIRYDPGGSVGRELERMRERQREASPKALSEHDVAFTRHRHKHILNRVRGRFDTMPVLCQFLLGTDIYWLVQIYFRVRELPFEGKKRAIEYLQRHELEIYHDLAAFYATDQPTFH